MSLHAILEAIRETGEAKIAEIEKQAYTQAHEITINSRLEAERIKEQAYISASEPASRERARILHRARLEALQITGNARETLVDAALEQARGRLSGIRTDAIYPDVMRRLLIEGLVELEGPERKERQGEPQDIIQPGMAVHLELDPRDHALVEGLLRDLGVELSISTHLECWGGLIVHSEDGRVSVIDTIEARLERAIPHLRQCLAALFENDQPEAMFKQPLEWEAAFKTK